MNCKNSTHVELLKVSSLAETAFMYRLVLPK